MKNFKKLREEALRQQHRHTDTFAEGDTIMSSITGEKGTIHRAGVNYVIALTEDGNMFRAWIKDVRHVNVTDAINKEGKVVFSIMERQKPVNSVQHNDAYSQALIEAYGKWMGGDGFQQSTVKESTAIPAPEKKELGAPGPAGGADASTSIPDLSGKEAKSDEGPKDIKASAGAPDPATDLRTGAGVKQSHGAEVKDTTKVVAREGYGAGKKKCPECGGKGCSHCGDTGFHKMKKEDVDILDEKKGLYANIHAKRKRGGTPAKPDRKIILQRTLSRRAQRLQRRKKFRLNSMARLTSSREK